MNAENILEKVNWKKYSIDLNTGSDDEYIVFAINETIAGCQNVCKTVKDTVEVNQRLKPVVNLVIDSCIEKMHSKGI